MVGLPEITFVVNFAALVIAVWLGWYIITRSPRSSIAWLTSITIWSMSGIFLNMLLAMNPLPVPEDHPAWIRFLFIFWSSEALEPGWSGWLSGWLATPAIAFWHHATMLMRPGKITPWQKVQVIIVYAVSGYAVYAQLNTPYMFSAASGDPLRLNALKPGSYYVVFMALLMLFAAMSIINLLASAKKASTALARKQFVVLAVATGIAGLTGLVSLSAVIDIYSIPRLINTVLLGIPIVLIGYSVAQYSATMQGRTIRREFIFNASMMALITLLYLAVTWVSAQFFSIPPAAYVFMILLAIATHSLVDFSQRYLEYFFYRKEGREWRNNLRQLARLNGENSLEEALEIIFTSTCELVRASAGIVVLFEGDNFRKTVDYQWHRRIRSASKSPLLSDDIAYLEPGSLTAQFPEAVLLLPLYNEEEQVGAIIMDSPVNSPRYSEEDTSRLLEASDHIADRIRETRRQTEYVSKAVKIAATRQIEPPGSDAMIPIKDIEAALRNIYDYAFLGNTKLIELKIVTQRLSKDAVTHVDKGKILNQVINEAVEKLRPTDQYPGDPPPREWHPYLILYGAYFEDKLNRDIMSQLYISEGTFNRTRRAALRSLARMLEEMEKALT